MSLTKHHSIPRLPKISQHERSLSTSQARPSIQYQFERYNPLYDPQLQIYLGKKSIKSKLLQMGYQLNPEQNRIVGKHPVKLKRSPKYQLVKNLDKKIPKNGGVIKQISKTQFDVYLKEMRRRIKQET